MKRNPFPLLLLATYSFISIDSFAQSQGPNKPDTVFNISFSLTAPWKNPLNAKDSNKVYSTDSLGGITTRSGFLEAKGFNFSIPSNATITGITVKVLGH